MRRIYLDHSATTSLDPRVLKAMTPYFSDKFGNASSIHSFGQEARIAVDRARKTVADFLNCKTNEIIFTSGGSESDNLAIRGLIEGAQSQTSNLKPQTYTLKTEELKNLITEEQLSNETIKQRNNNYAALPHVVTSSFEHHAVLDTIEEMERGGVIEATYIKPDKEGIIRPKDVQKSIKNNTVLVSIMYVNNEIGTVQPIREIGKILERINRIRYPLGFARGGQVSGIKQKKNLPKIFFHSDAVQAAEYFNMDVNYLHLDLLTLSAHKIYGPKGVGVLYIREGTPLKHQIVGGGQEYKLRAGTENVAGIVGLAEAIKVTSKLKTQNSKIMKLRNKLIEGIEKSIPKSELNGSKICRSPNNINITFDNAEGESILLNLDAQGIAASSGSACTSGSLEPSHVLLSIGMPAEKAHGSIRFTLGRDTSQEEVDYLIKVLPDIIKKLRKMSPYK